MAGQETQQSPAAEPGFFYGYIVVAAAFSILVVVYGAYTTFGIFFKPLITEFGWTRAMTSGAFSVSRIVTASLAIAMGGFSDKVGPRIVMTICGLLLGLGYLLMSQIGAIWQLYLFYGVIIGTGMAGAFVPLMSTVARWFVKRRSMMTGIVLAGVGTGILIVPPVASRLISAYDWRMSYIILGSTVLVVVVLAAQLLRREPIPVGQMAYSEFREEKQAVKSGTEGFCLREAIYTKQLWIASAMFFCYGVGVYTIMVHIVPHAAELGIPAISAANILAIIGGLSIVGKVVLGRAADRIGNRQAFIIGFIMMSVALFWLVPATEAWMLYLFAIVFAFGYGGCAASESPIVAALFGLRSHGLILAVTDLGFTIGAAIGPFLAGYIFDTSGSYQVAFLVCAATAVVGLILSAVLKPIGSEIGRGGD